MFWVSRAYRLVFIMLFVFTMYAVALPAKIRFDIHAKSWPSGMVTSCDPLHMVKPSLCGIEGVIVSLKSNSLMVRLDNGKEVLVTINSQGICIKERRRINLSGFKVGERVVIMATGEYLSGNVEALGRLEALAIQDAESYGVSKGGYSVSAPSSTAATSVPSKPQTSIYDDPLVGISPELRDKLLTYLPDGKLPTIGDTGPGGPGTGVGGYDFISPRARNSGPVDIVSSPAPLPANQNNSSSQNNVSANTAPLKFIEGEGRISEINITGNRLSVMTSASSTLLNITISEKTKIYRFINNQFEFLSLSQLKIGDKVKASGFRQGDDVLLAMMIILLSK